MEILTAKNYEKNRSLSLCIS